MKKTITEKLITIIIEKLVEYLEMSPAEQEEKKQLLKEKIDADREKMKKRAKTLGYTITGIIILMLYGIAVSEPMRNLITTIFSKMSPVSDAFYDFLPKLFAISLMYAFPSLTLLMFVWLYGMKERDDIKGPAKISSIATVITAGGALLSALFCALAEGSFLPVLWQIATLLTPPMPILMVAFIASFMAAVAVSVAELGIQTKSAYADIKGWWKNRKKK